MTGATNIELEKLVEDLSQLSSKLRSAFGLTNARDALTTDAAQSTIVSLQADIVRKDEALRQISTALTGENRLAEAMSNTAKCALQPRVEG